MSHDHDWDNAFTGRGLRGSLPQASSYAGAQSFLRRRYSRDLEGVDVAVLGIPLDLATSNRPGARFGPRAIRAASSSMTWARPWPWDFDPLEALAIVDYGDCAFDFTRPETMIGTIERAATNILESGAACLALGGDHFASYPLLRAHAAIHGPLSLLHFDAHSDTWPDEGGQLHHGVMFHRAATEGLVVPERSVQIGLRTTNDDTLGFQIMDARWVMQHGPAAVVERAREILKDQKVYLTFDIDCLDPAFAPGTGTPVCGGLSSYQALEIIRGLAGIDVVGMDVVEVAPAYDSGEITAFAAASVATEVLCLHAAGKAARREAES